MPQYNPYYPASYQPITQPTQNQNSITWVSGEVGAKSYIANPNTSVLLMDSEADVFYIKTTDASGMPLPLRVFDYKERIEQPKPNVDMNAYVTKEEFEKALAELKEVSHAEPIIPTIATSEHGEYAEPNKPI